MSTEFINDQWRLPNAFNGTESNVNKQSNYSMDFDGSSQYIDTTDKFNFIHNTKIFSISAWVKMDSYSDNTLGLILGNNYTASNSQSGFMFWTDNRQNAAGKTEALNFILWDGTNTTFLNIENVVNDNNWHNYIVVGDGTTLKYYKDGTQLSTTASLSASTSTTAFANLRLGADTYSPPSIYLNGKIDGVAIYNYALSSSQVTTLYGSSSTGIGNPMSLSPKPVAYYPLGDQDAFNGANYLVPNSSLKDYVFDFDGSSDYINLNFQSQTTPATISMWVNTDVNDSQQRYAIINGRADQQPTVYLRMQSDNTYQVFISNTNGFDTLQGSSATINTWFHFAIVCENSQTLLYENGVLKDSSTIGWNGIDIDQSNNWQLGRDSRGQRYWNGQISNAQIFNTALPATGSNSVETLYNNGSPLTSMSGYSSLVGWWKLNASDTYDGTNWTIEDHAGSNDGTSSGMTQANLVQSDLSFKTSISPFALEFDSASSDAITLGNTIGNSFTQITCSIWANISTSGLTQSTYRNFLVKFPTGGFSATPFELRSSNGNRVDTYNNKLFFRVNTNTGGYGFTDTGFEFTEANKWHHLVGTYDGSNVKLFVDGVEYYSISASGTLNSNPNNATIGKSGSTGDFNGKLSNASIWNVALTSAQVTELYNEGVPSNLNNHSAYSNLVSWWQLGSNSSFNSSLNQWTCIDEKGTNTGESSQTFNEDAIVDGVGSYANGVGTSGLEVIGSAPFSDANSLSINMDVLDRSTDVPN